MKFINLDKSKIDPYKLRKKTFFKGIFEDRRKNFKNLKFLINKKRQKCPLCLSSKVKNGFLKINKFYRLNRCEACELVFPNTKFLNNKNYVEAVYKKYSDQNHRKMLYKTRKYRTSTFIKERYDYCVKRIFKKRKDINVLEYGCGTGMFLSELSKKKIKCQGLEVDPYQIEVAKNNGLNVKNIKLQSLKNNTFDLCVMFDVLEHLTKPISEFKILRKKVKKGGYVICYSPNIYSLAFELMGENQNQVYPFEHLYFFGKKTLEIFSRKSGFKIVNYETFGLDLTDYFLFREFKDKKNYVQKLKDFINIVQPIIDNSNLGNHFRVTFKKI